MTDVTLDLQTAIFKALVADDALSGALGGARVFDQVPARIAFPYIVVGRTAASDWSTSTEEGEAIIFFVHVWTQENSRAEALSLQGHVKRILTDGEMVLDNHHLIHLRFQLAETRRNRSQNNLHGVMRFRAVTEPK